MLSWNSFTTGMCVQQQQEALNLYQLQDALHTQGPQSNTHMMVNGEEFNILFRSLVGSPSDRSEPAAKLSWVLYPNIPGWFHRLSWIIPNRYALHTCSAAGGTMYKANKILLEMFDIFACTHRRWMTLELWQKVVRYLRWNAALGWDFTTSANNTSRRNQYFSKF